jgi:hypothetical protein
MLIVADRQPFVSPGPRLATTDGTRSLEESPGYAPEMPRLFHVTSALNRESIMEHGLDSTRMGAARGIAGSDEPEEDGVFLCLDEFDANYFVDMNNTGGPVDVWAVEGVNQEQLLTTQSGYNYFPAPIPPERLTLIELQPDPRGGLLRAELTTSDAYQSRLTLTLDDGTMASDDEASNFLPRGQGDDTTEPDVATEP